MFLKFCVFILMNLHLFFCWFKTKKRSNLFLFDVRFREKVNFDVCFILISYLCAIAQAVLCLLGGIENLYGEPLFFGAIHFVALLGS